MFCSSFVHDMWGMIMEFKGHPKRYYCPPPPLNCRCLAKEFHLSTQGVDSSHHVHTNVNVERSTISCISVKNIQKVHILVPHIVYIL